jgi:hypothetical protein
MHDPTMTAALPTPEQMRNYLAAEKAAWLARRLREASRAMITGNIAFVACLLGTILVVVHSDWFAGAGPFVLCGIMLGYVACLILSLRWMMRERSRSSVMVLDQREVEARRALAHPVRVTVVISGLFLFQMLAVVLWGFAFRHMSNATILAALAVGPALATGFFVYRFVVYRFWEDLLFAAAVLMAHTPFFIHAWDLTPLCLAALAAVIVGTVSLHRRWVHWTRSLPAEDGDGGVREVQS